MPARSAASNQRGFLLEDVTADGLIDAVGRAAAGEPVVFPVVCETPLRPALLAGQLLPGRADGRPISARQVQRR